MAKTKEQKKEIVQNLAEKISQMKSVVFSDYYGLTVKDMSELRGLLRKANCQYLVTKKTLLELALKERGIKEVNLKEVAGGIGLTFCWEDEVAGAKILADFAKKHKLPQMKAGILVLGPKEYRFLNESEIKELSRLPSKIELLIKTFWTIKAPINNFVHVLRGNLQGLVCALEAIKEQKS